MGIARLMALEKLAPEIHQVNLSIAGFDPPLLFVSGGILKGTI
jgi:hypothetical protein